MGLPERTAESPRWYALQTRYRFEKRVAQQLHEKQIESFVPLRAEVHGWSDRRKEIDVPLFPGYAFVHTVQSHNCRLHVLRTAGVIGFVESSGEPVPVSAQEIEHLRMILAQKVPCSLHPFLKVGQRVRIRGGCLNGLQGVLCHTGRKSLIVSIDAIQQSVAVEIQGYELELV
ncbi:MAG TPA: UpxY family transcription antiterminator [Terriglobales bacterium]|nr:UpxY family transcription antiterminator [Terriglobales bacterium]